MTRAAAMRRIIVIPMISFLFSGCSSIAYYAQSVAGQLDIWGRERAITEIIADPAAPAVLKEKLELVTRLRAFASRELGLPDNASYRTYANLERPFVVWNVFAAPEFSVSPVRWCFPFAGCVSYRGYFARADADRFAARLRRDGYDVFVSGIPAYSTLGWFADPVLNTFLHYPEADLARLIFHELAHQVVYVSDDSVFNESFAVAVEQEGVKRWFARQGSTQAGTDPETMNRRREGFAALLLATRERLAALYATDLPAAEKRARKAGVFDDLQRDYRKLRAAWGGYAGYDRWFAQQPNNAHVASVALYNQLVPGFQALLAAEGGDLPRFYERVRDLAALPRDERTGKISSP